MITCNEVQLECSHFLTSLFYDRAKDRLQTSSKARSTIRFIDPPGATGNYAPLQACGAPVSGVRFVVGALPRCASALSAECSQPHLRHMYFKEAQLRLNVRCLTGKI
jgi:hypothetical protein